MSENTRLAYFISDRTGITSEGLGEALLNQFDNIKILKRTHPFIDSEDKAYRLLEKIAEEATSYSQRPLIFSSIVDQHIRRIIHSCSGLHIDFYDTFIHELEKELNLEARRKIGATHGLDPEKYDKRMEAVNFALNHDDGVSEKELKRADVILLGVSRSGKTPTCLYLAMQYGIRAANYPLTPDDLTGTDLPVMVKPYRHKLFGLTIDSNRLQQIREERRPNSNYSSMNTCRNEVSVAEEMYHRYRIPFVNSTHKSVEELSAAIMQIGNLKRRF